MPAFWIGLVCLMPWFAPAAARARPIDSLASSSPNAAATGQPPEQGLHQRHTKRKRRKHGKVGSLPGRSVATAHRRERRHHSPAPSAQPAKVALVQSPGPAQTPAALRAMDKVRHMQIERAEDAARRQELTNRWQTVNFLISGVDEQRYPAAGFWKALSCYRLGRVDEGDSARQRCRLSAADARALDDERAVALLMTSKNGGPPLRGATLSAAVPEPPDGAVNNAAYAGPGPTPEPISAAAP